MVGQEFVVSTLQKSIAAGKIAHAYLFSGPRGCGKTSSARILARALNCESGPTATPCGTCPACREITRGASLDVIEIDGASNTSVNDVRQIKDEVQFPPNSCRYKVYIIDEVHMLSTSAFNALLKTIEEPPPYVIFIFATTELHKVPATIKSRCQQFNFRLVPVETLKDVLSQAAAESGIQADDEALFWIAREGTGSVRDSYTLFDQVAAFSDGHITFEKIRDKLGLVGVDRINPVVEACADKRAQDALLLVDDIVQNGVSVEQFVTDLADYFRSLLLLKAGIQKESLLGLSPERFSSVVLSAWGPAQIERALGIMLQLFRDIRYSLDPRYELDLAVSRLAWLSDYVSNGELTDAISRAQRLLAGAPPVGAPGAQPRASGGNVRGPGPFNEANRPSAGQAAVRVDAPQNPETDLGDDSPPGDAYSPEPAESFDDGEETVIENPFAAFKARFAGGNQGRGAATGAVPAVASSPSSPASAVASVSSVKPATPQMPVSPSSVSVLSTGSVGTSGSAGSVVANAANPSLAQEPLDPQELMAGPDTAASETNQDSAAGTTAQDSVSEPVSGIVPFESLKDRLVEHFQSTKNMVATSIQQSTSWLKNGASISFCVDKPFVHNFLEQDHKAIAEACSRFLGQPISLEIRLTIPTAAAQSRENSIPPQVEMVRQMFRGTIAGDVRKP